MAPASDQLHQVRKYRAFIDGLRAVAILTVVGSHSGLPGLHGGFIGVDIFFVISGYLIINQIVEDIEAKRFSFFGFAMRRTFRILPAFLLVMVSTLVLATTVFVQPEHKEFAESFLLSGVMLANHHFLAHQGYFDMAAVTRPLLHMWSLAVEEQFYLLAPLTLLSMTAATAGMSRTNRSKAWSAMTILLGIASLAVCIAFTYPPGRPNVSFYIMPARGWEFILGGAVPSLATAMRRLPAWVSEWLAFAGLVAIVAAVVWFDPETIYPSYWATAPAAGATLIIVGGLLNPGGYVVRALATAPMVGVGLVSYSWYLWHWPLISFVLTINFGQQQLGEQLAAAAVALVLATLTYRFVEVPTRRWRQQCPFRPGGVVAAGALSCLLVAGLGYLWSLRVAPLMQPQLSGLEPVRSLAGGYPSVSHRGVLLGDSHAIVITKPLQDYARRAGAVVSAITRAGCPPILNAEVKDDRGRIASYCDPFFQKIAFQGDEFAIITARWNFYLGLPPSDPLYASDTLVAAGAADGAQDPYQIMAKGLAAAVGRAKQAGVRRILVIGPLPEFPWHAPYCVMRSIRLGIDICSIPRANVEARRAKTISTLRGVLDHADGVRFVDPIDLFCTRTECRPNDGAELFFSDMSHLSTAGTARLYGTFAHDFLWALTGEVGKNGSQSKSPH
ncbi:MAG TPA: acyltransferase family protein [Pseudolabrys sp.]|nr:acyltransferase family protein [Pseudolabrys sp.]